LRFLPKFRPGDTARIGGKGRPLPACYPWLCRGRKVKIAGGFGRTKGGHIEYLIRGRRGRPDLILASYDMRRPDERDRAPGAGRKSLRNRD
jgi:hypothetical protein